MPVRKDDEVAILRGKSIIFIYFTDQKQVL